MIVRVRAVVDAMQESTFYLHIIASFRPLLLSPPLTPPRWGGGTGRVRFSGAGWRRAR